MARPTKAELLAQATAAGLAVDESMTVAQLTELLASSSATSSSEPGDTVGEPAQLVQFDGGRVGIVVGHRGGSEPAWQVVDLAGGAICTVTDEPAPLTIAAF